METTIEKLFDKIPSSEQMRNGESENIKIITEKFINRVIEIMNTEQKDNFTFEINGEESKLLNGISGETIKKQFLKKGWEIKIEHSPRNETYATIKAKLNEGPYGYGCSQFDR